MIIIGEISSPVKYQGEISHIITDMIIGTRIKELRLEQKISQNTLAKAIGVDKRAVIFWEQEVNEPKASYIVKLAQYFGVPTDYLLGLTDVY